MTKKMHEKLGRFHGTLLKIDLAMLTFVLLPFVLILEKFYAPATRGDLWRKVAHWIVVSTFNINGVKLKIKQAKQTNTQGGNIYAANHASEMDGFMLFAILGHKTVLFTMPNQAFPPILKTWVKKMEAIDVIRDQIDAQSYPKANNKHQAIELAVNHLKMGHSLIIFPEGHIEKLHVLHYFHTGTARISLKSHTPIIPVSIVNADQVFPDESSLHPGTVLFSFGKPIKPDPNAKLFERPKVLNLRDKIEKQIVKHLPHRYLPPLYKQNPKNVGVFVDIDRTIYEGLSQKDLITYLMYLHKIKAKEAFKIFYWLFMEKTHHLPHKDLMQQSLMVLNGWDMAELDHYVHEAFQKKMLHKVQYGFFPILKDHAEAGHSIILVSEVIHPLAKEFKRFIKANASLDTKLKTVNHCYTGETPCLCYKDKKADLISKFAKRTGVNLNKSFAYADSYSDLQFLSLVKHPCAVNPDHELLEHAVENNWQVMLDAS
ncbi:hypothetical protein HN858_04445 [Candidatus Falkowbacteria bacterium]|jgi:HAD superfamily hydrolase (TIGR01490 family)|nr:hypothetical protein [Candidatus Falkowbacteria bacterium]MBT5503835.1 hypothetical protein [Candidatus Falkowbacteria bacterium]MBT6574373.1 hypothetical protein [Candidatus Falkowbacteria bacterium]MBT7348894.1 hypothetical protein [Candidatus Falkowbacteria bacterium]MBT7501045.1 hypothetical protein [Candidatus Falkowbacteria bacterium]